MIPTTQLRILRTPSRACPSLLSNRRTLSHFPALPRRASPCPQTRWHALRAAFTTTTLQQARGAASSPLKPNDPEPEVEHRSLSRAAANPPASTRPAPLDLPARDPDKSTFSFYFATGKAYLKFYKTGLKNVYLNTRLIWSLDQPSAAPTTIDPATRAAFLLRRRWRHDIRRLPPFALILLVCGEFTPFIVLAFPSLVPYTCRIPRQLAAIQRKTEERRAASFARLQRAKQELDQRGDNNNKLVAEKKEEGARVSAPATGPPKVSAAFCAQATMHIARSLNLVSPLWDRLPLPDTAVALLTARRTVQQHVLYLARDDFLLKQAGGVGALEREEVVLACLDRALNHLDQDEEALRARLAQWLQRVPDALQDPTPTWVHCHFIMTSLTNGSNRLDVPDTLLTALTDWVGQGKWPRKE